MSRNPFVWQIQVRREVLDDEMARLRQVPYSLWRDVVASPIRKVVGGRDNKDYLVRVSADYVKGSRDIRVTLSLASTGWLQHHLMRQSFTITPDNEFHA